MDNQQPPEFDPYETLQVSRRADAEVIEAAYRVLARRYHPDLNGSPGATAQMSQINGAWETLRDPARRAAYDRQRDGGGLVHASAAAPTAAPDGNAAGPVLVVEPARLVLGAVRRGSRRTLSAGVYTEPPGIRVEASVASGTAWLAVSPTVLAGLDQERVGVDIRTGALQPGSHRGAIEFTTSWETRLLPVEVEVQPARMLFRAAALLRHGPAGSSWRDSTAAAVLAVLLLAVIIAALVVIAVGR